MASLLKYFSSLSSLLSSLLFSYFLTSSLFLWVTRDGGRRLYREERIMERGDKGWGVRGGQSGERTRRIKGLECTSGRGAGKGWKVARRQWWTKGGRAVCGYEAGEPLAGCRRSLQQAMNEWTRNDGESKMGVINECVEVHTNVLCYATVVFGGTKSRSRPLLIQASTHVGQGAGQTLNLDWSRRWFFWQVMFHSQTRSINIPLGQDAPCCRRLVNSFPGKSWHFYRF